MLVTNSDTRCLGSVLKYRLFQLEKVKELYGGMQLQRRQVIVLQMMVKGKKLLKKMKTLMMIL